MLNLSTLLRATDPEFLRQANKYRADMFKIDKAKDVMGPHIRVIGVLEGGNKPKKVSIKCYDQTISQSSRCVVYCSCDLFRYKLEIALAARGSAVRTKAADRMPVKTNPNLLPGLCPHLVYLTKLALSSDTAKEAVIKQTVSPKLKQNR